MDKQANDIWERRRQELVDVLEKNGVFPSGDARNAKNERGYFLGLILERLKGTKVGGKEISIGFLVRKLEGIPTEDVKFLHSRCLESKSYPRAFFGLLKHEAPKKG